MEKVRTKLAADVETTVIKKLLVLGASTNSAPEAF
jgi:hypothetical protein